MNSVISLVLKPKNYVYDWFQSFMMDEKQNEKNKEKIWHNLQHKVPLSYNMANDYQRLSVSESIICMSLASSFAKFENQAMEINSWIQILNQFFKMINK